MIEFRNKCKEADADGFNLLFTEADAETEDLKNLRISTFTNSDFGAPKNLKVRLDLFMYNPKNDIYKYFAAVNLAPLF